MKLKITQQKAIFYFLWKNYWENSNRFIPAWKFIGELHIKELGVSFFMSYKCPARASDLYNENQALIERRETIGPSGAKYFEYKIRDGAKKEWIKSKEIREFHQVLKEAERRSKLRPLIPN